MLDEAWLLQLRKKIKWYFSISIPILNKGITRFYIWHVRWSIEKETMIVILCNQQTQD